MQTYRAVDLRGLPTGESRTPAAALAGYPRPAVSADPSHDCSAKYGQAGLEASQMEPFFHVAQSSLPLSVLSDGIRRALRSHCFSHTRHAPVTKSGSPTKRRRSADCQSATMFNHRALIGPGGPPSCWACTSPSITSSTFWDGNGMDIFSSSCGQGFN